MEQKKDKMKPLQSILNFIATIVVGLAIGKFIIVYIVCIVLVSGSSMNPTLHDGQKLFCNKLIYKIGEPERFDIIAFEAENYEERVLIKRIIGLPGEKLRIDMDGNIYINDKIIEDIEGLDKIKSPGLAIEEITIGKDEYFVMGDNRNNSLDSRFEVIGNVHIDDILGKCADMQ